MGLDLLETFLAIEEAFEIHIPDADAAKLDTPAKLIDYLCARLGKSPDGPPLDQSAFYWLRKGLADELTISPKLIRPATTIDELTARAENDVWKAVAGRLQVHPKFLTHAPVAKWLAKLVRAPGRTVGELAKQVAMLHPSAFKSNGDGWTRAQITQVVLRLIEHEAAIKVGPEDLDAHFYRDLGMD